MKGLPKKKGRVGAANIKGMSIEYGPAKKIIAHETVGGIYYKTENLWFRQYLVTTH